MSEAPHPAGGAVEAGEVISKLRAYEITEPYEHQATVLFARSNIEARRRGAAELDQDEIGGLRCRRAPWADQFAAIGHVPVSACIAQGWRFEECSGCGMPLSNDDLDDAGLSIDGVVGDLGSAIFCCQACKDRDDARTARCKARGEEGLQILRGIVLKRFPGVTFETGPWREHAYATEERGHLVAKQLVVSFSFPGQKYGPAALRWDDTSGHKTAFVRGRGHRPVYGPPALEWSCCNGDREAFEAFVAAPRPAADPAARALTDPLASETQP